jgi:hypothetical protein
MKQDAAQNQCKWLREITNIIFIIIIRYAECRDEGVKRLKGQCDLGHHLLVPDSEKRLKVRVLCNSYTVLR